jgi:predicted Rossmann fold flavoprotein
VDWDVVVVGGGAAGLVAAQRAAARGRRTLLLEKNRRPGVKILMSGGTRCNLTQATDSRGIVAAFGPQGRFLHSALAQLGPQDLVALVEQEGVPMKVEPGGKIFPVSNRATDVLAAFLARLDRSGCTLALDEPLLDIQKTASGFELATSKRRLTTENLIITTGGKSYPRSGTTGDGYSWAKKFGHTVVSPRPALVPLIVPLDWIRDLQGVTVPDVRLRLLTVGTSSPSTKLDQRRGSLLFTHFGLSGPVALDISTSVTARLEKEKLALEIDFLPETSESSLDDQLCRRSSAAGKRHLAALLPQDLPRRLADALIAQAGVHANLTGAQLTRQQRTTLAQAIKRTIVPIAETRGFDKAEVTAGGVALDEVDPRTMQSRLVPNLYWAGEVLDLDGPIGGYNFQAAFSTGWLAGLRV